MLRQNCTIMNDKQLMSFTIFDVDVFVYTVFIEPKDDTACFSSNNDTTITVVMVHLTFVLALT